MFELFIDAAAVDPRGCGSNPAAFPASFPFSFLCPALPFPSSEAAQNGELSYKTCGLRRVGNGSFARICPFPQFPRPQTGKIYTKPGRFTWFRTGHLISGGVPCFAFWPENGEPEGGRPWPSIAFLVCPGQYPCRRTEKRQRRSLH